MKHLMIAAAAAALISAPAYAALPVGAKAPAFTAPAFQGGKPFQFDLADALKKGPVVLYFFPAAHTAGCNIEAHLFADSIDKFKAEGATVIGVTAGNVDQLAAFSTETEHCGGKLPVAADPGAVIAKQYDSVLAQKPDWSSRTSYVIARDGTIKHVYDNLNPSEHVNETLGAVRALNGAKSK